MCARAIENMYDSHNDMAEHNKFHSRISEINSLWEIAREAVALAEQFEQLDKELLQGQRSLPTDWKLGHALREGIGK